MIRLPLIAAGLAVSALGSLHGVRTSDFVDEGFSSFNEGELKDISLGNDGRLESAPGVSLVTVIDEPIIWAAAFDAEGRLILGTGNRGRVLRVDREGGVETIFRPDQMLSRALAVDDEGNTYVGTSPGGAIYRLPADGGLPQIFFDPDPAYLWDMHVRDGALWVATGLPARLLRIPLDGGSSAEAETWFSARTDHLTTLYPDADGVWWAGSSPDGILYRIDAKDDAFAAFNANEREIKAIARHPNGRLVFSTYSGEERSGVPRDADDADDGFLPPLVVTGEGASDGDADAGQRRARGRGMLYEIDETGFVRPVWQARRSGMFSLYGFGENYWLVGMNTRGRIYGFESRNQWSLVQQFERGGEISLILEDSEEDGLLVVTSNPGALYRLGGVGSEASVFTSRVHDGGQVARWGRMDILKEGTPLAKVEVRAGNTRRPDSTWTGWREAEWSDGAMRAVVATDLPAARYLQYRLELAPESDGAVRRVRGFYQLPNVAPHIADLAIVNGGFELEVQTANGPNYEFDMAFSDGGRERLEGVQRQRARLRRFAADGFLTLVWRPADPNNDRMEFAVEMQRADDDSWVKIADKLEEPLFAWNVKGLDEGFYRFRVRASDHPDNEPAEALEGTRVSDYVLVDNSPPRITLRDENLSGSTAAFRFRAADEWSVLRDARWSLNGGPYTHVRPEGGLFDSREHEFSIRLEDLPAGSHTLLLEVVDEAGRSAVHTHRFRLE